MSVALGIRMAPLLAGAPSGLLLDTVPFRSKMDVAFFHADDIVGTSGSTMSSGWPARAVGSKITAGTLTAVAPFSGTFTAPTVSDTAATATPYGTPRVAVFGGTNKLSFSDADMKALVNGANKPVYVYAFGEVTGAPAGSTIIAWSSAAGTANTWAAWTNGTTINLFAAANKSFGGGAGDHFNVGYQAIAWSDTGTVCTLSKNGTAAASTAATTRTITCDRCDIGSFSINGADSNGLQARLRAIWISTQPLTLQEQQQMSAQISAGMLGRRQVFGQTDAWNLLYFMRQSNAKGPISGTFATNSSVKMWPRGVDDLFLWVKNPSAPEAFGPQGGGTPQYGMWRYTVASALAASRRLGLCIAARGSTALSGWTRNTFESYYATEGAADQMWMEERRALREFEAFMGGAPNLISVAIGGEQDAQTGVLAATYASQLTAWATALRTFWGLSGTAKVYNVRLNTNDNPPLTGAQITEIRNGETSANGTDPNIILIESNDLVQPGDLSSLHYTDQGAQVLGARIYTTSDSNGSWV